MSLNPSTTTRRVLIMTSDVLPDGWREAYYQTEIIDDTYTLVTAAYEHTPTGVKKLVVPNCTPEAVRNIGHTTHDVYNVFPVYKDVGLPIVFSNECSNMYNTIRSIVPEVRPRETPNRNSGPYQIRQDTGEPKSMVGGPRVAEGDFDWEGTLPSEALEAMSTYKQFPLDYSILTENIDNLSTADSLSLAEPGVLPDPFPLKVVIRKGDEENFLYTKPTASRDFWETVSSYFDVGAIDPECFEEGTELATVYIEFQRDSFPYNPRVLHIEVPEDEPLPLNSRMKVLLATAKHKLHNISPI